MREKLKEIFEKNGIEYFDVIDIKDTTVNKSYLLDRLGKPVKSAIVYLMPYYAGEPVNISRYATSLDYHIVNRRIADRIIPTLSALYPEESFLSFADHSPIDERAAALKLGLGVIGKNGLIINEKYGSYVFIGEIVTSVSSEALGGGKIGAVKECIGCGKCLTACPTGILRGEGCDCLSAITQKKSELNESEISLMRKYNTAWGCDICQSVCPYNKKPKITPIPDFKTDNIYRLDREILDNMSEEEFQNRAFSWRGKDILYRNLDALEK